MRAQVTIDEATYEYLASADDRAVDAIMALRHILDDLGIHWYAADSPAMLRERYLDELPRRVERAFLAGQGSRPCES